MSTSTPAKHVYTCSPSYCAGMSYVLIRQKYVHSYRLRICTRIYNTILSHAIYVYLNAASVMTQGASSASVVKDLLVAAAEGRLHEVQSLLDGGRCRVNDEDEVCIYVPVGWYTSVSE